MATRKTAAKPAPAPAAPVRRRVKVGGEAEASSSYFTSGADKDNITFFSSGCATLDEALGGGWPLGRVSNIVGDKSAGKTLLAMEAIANFALKFPEGKIRYAEAEDAFDEPYARALGIPMDRIEFNRGRPMSTVEDWFNDLTRCMDEWGTVPSLYIEDSLDALSDAAEMERGFDEASFGGNKPKQIGKLFRTINDRMSRQQMHLMVISQLRDKIGVTFGETKTRSGGKALDFYASQILWLAEIGKLKRTVKGVERIVGADIRAKVKKNKVGLPFREVDYPVLFGYGIDDLTSMIEWLQKVNRDKELEELGFSKKGYTVLVTKIRNDNTAARELREKLKKLVRKTWAEIENDFLPTSRKY